MQENSVMELNADVGEQCGDDITLIPLVDRVNIATGAHAGGGIEMRHKIVIAHHAGCHIGAHISYNDHANFGRTSHLPTITEQQLRATIRTQLGEFLAAASKHKTHVDHVKPHGALYHDMHTDPMVQHVIVTEARDHDLALMGMTIGDLENHATRRGVRFIPEGFADRAYTPTGVLLSRDHPHAVHTDPITAISQAHELARQYVTTHTGERINLTVRSICVHGDTPQAVSLTRRIRTSLHEHGYLALGA